MALVPHSLLLVTGLLVDRVKHVTRSHSQQQQQIVQTMFHSNTHPMNCYRVCTVLCATLFFFPQLLPPLMITLLRILSTRNTLHNSSTHNYLHQHTFHFVTTTGMEETFHSINTGNQNICKGGTRSKKKQRWR
eukprot:PhF_6_TR8033/c0_g1_i1/m.12452